jgi:hypothetical protein
MKVHLYPVADKNIPDEVCSVLGCIFQATHWWTFITPKVALCQFHYDFPTPRFKDLVDETRLENRSAYTFDGY